MKFRPEDAREDHYDLFYTVQTDPKDETEKKEVACGEIIMRVSARAAPALVVLFE